MFVAAPAFAAPSPTLSLAGWWERITVTMTGDGKAQSCRYETSATGAKGRECKVVGGPTEASQSAAAQAQMTTIIFERRFSPGAAQPQDGALQAGDKLLGRQVLALAIDGGGKVSGCKVVVASGDVGLDYGCEEAAAERFEVKASRTAAEPKRGYMTVRIYGHAEQVA
jgi:hypothetical protein